MKALFLGRSPEPLRVTLPEPVSRRAHTLHKINPHFTVRSIQKHLEVFI